MFIEASILFLKLVKAAPPIFVLISIELTYILYTKALAHLIELVPKLRLLSLSGTILVETNVKSVLPPPPPPIIITGVLSVML